MLRDNGVQSLFHFTDAANLASIREHGLLAWKKIERDHIECKMNSSILSHKLDTRKGFENYIRLSFCRKHPMMFQALKEKRITRPVILEIKLQVVSRPGVLFCERNATASDAQTSANPNVIRFEVVNKPYGAVSNESKPFYQGEVLVPESVPPHLIRFPKVDAFNTRLEEETEVSVEHESLKPKLLEAERGAEFCGHGSCSKPELDEATPMESQDKNVLPVLSDVGVGFSVASLELSSSASSSEIVQPLKPAECSWKAAEQEAKSGEEGLLAVVTTGAASEVSSPPSCVDTDMKGEKATLEVKTEQPGITPLDYPSNALGGVVAIKADGHCCYHLGGMFQLLCRNPNALSQGFARCLPKDTQAARE